MSQSSWVLHRIKTANLMIKMRVDEPFVELPQHFKPLRREAMRLEAPHRENCERRPAAEVLRMQASLLNTSNPRV